MSDHDLLMFAFGANFGVYLILLVRAAGHRLDDRRDRRLLEETRAKLNASREAAR